MRASSSIRHRIIALHLIAVLAVAVVLPLALYWRVDATARALHERALREQAQQISQYLHRQPDGRFTLDLPDTIRDLYSEGYGRYGFAILARSGQVLFSAGAHDEPLFRSDPLRSSPSYFERDAGKLRLFGTSMPFAIGGDTVWIQISQDQAHRDVLIDDIVAEFLPHVAWVIIPILLVLLGIDLLIFGRALQPLEEASARAERISPSRTDIRLPEVRMPADVLPLVHAVNEALERLEQGFIMQRDFVADAAHELRTPLAILRAEMEASPRHDNTAVLLADIDSMTRIVNQLMDVAESDTLMIKSDEVADLRTVAAEAISFMAPIAVAQGRGVAMAGATDPVWVYGNSGALFRAVRNLVENAITHTARGTTVEISVDPAGRISVRDEGDGIPVSQRDQIFERFWRADRRRAGSAGLGLSIVARIVKAHGGEVSVSDAPRRGTIFAIRLRPAIPT
jgi:signal transduction histidine kinase